MVHICICNQILTWSENGLNQKRLFWLFVCFVINCFSSNVPIFNCFKSLVVLFFFVITCGGLLLGFTIMLHSSLGLTWKRVFISMWLLCVRSTPSVNSELSSAECTVAYRHGRPRLSYPELTITDTFTITGLLITCTCSISHTQLNKRDFHSLIIAK